MARFEKRRNKLSHTYTHTHTQHISLLPLSPKKANDMEKKNQGYRAADHTWEKAYTTHTEKRKEKME